MLTNSGAFILKRRLNYNLVQKYNFIVTAKVSDVQCLFIIIQFRAIKHILKGRDGSSAPSVSLSTNRMTGG